MNSNFKSGVACEQALLFGRAKRAARERTSRLLSRASRASTFHDIPQIESLLAGQDRGWNSSYFSTNWPYGDENDLQCCLDSKRSW